MTSTKMTIEKLRSYKGLSHLTDEAAQKVIQSLKMLAQVAFRLYNTRSKQNNSIKC